VTWPDLDSHLNLVDDPFKGLPVQGDVLIPPAGPGLGIDLGIAMEQPSC
jgi:L-Ala-D/L-Glu epimerase